MRRGYGRFLQARVPMWTKKTFTYKKKSEMDLIGALLDLMDNFLDGPCVWENLDFLTKMPFSLLIL